MKLQQKYRSSSDKYFDVYYMITSLESQLHGEAFICFDHSSFLLDSGFN